MNMLVRREFHYEFGADESGDIVDDAVYDRNRKIEEKFGIKLTITDVEGSFSTRDTFLGVLAGDIMSGSGDIDIVAGAANYMLPTVPEGNFVNLMQTPYIETDNPWWSQGYVDNMSIDGGLYWQWNGWETLLTGRLDKSDIFERTYKKFTIKLLTCIRL